MPDTNPAAQLKAATALRKARHVVALTGAGISKDSGLPTFREAQAGLWARFRPEDLATPEAFARDPGTVWAWYAWRRHLVAAAEPNPGHHAMVAMESRVRAQGGRFTLVTQNVDGLHQRAGSADVVELHGNISRIVCSRCRHHVDPGSYFADPGNHSIDPGHHPDVFAGPGHAGAAGGAAGAEGAAGTADAAPAGHAYPEPPLCSLCGGWLRPDVVWFGEMLPEAALARSAEEAASCDVFISAGTSGLVYPAAGLVQVARRGGADIIVVNPDDDVVPGACWLRGSASGVLPALVAAAWPDAGGR
jgi:NAD-dependent deacetylase